MSRPTHQDWPSDDVLVAYADGTLDADAAAAVAKHLENDAKARAFVRALQDSADLARHAFDEALDAPASAKLVDTIINGTAAHTVARPPVTNVVPLRRQQGFAQPQAMALAACLALLIGGLGGFQLGQRTGIVTTGEDEVAVGLVKNGTTLRQALERVASNEPVSLSTSGDAKAEMIIVATFRDATGRICRELEVTEGRAAAGGITAAVACRQPDGNWLVEGAVRMAASPSAPDHDFTPAKGDKSSAIEGVLSAIGAKRALAPADEQQLLKNGWK